MNALDDVEVIRALYHASNSGVEINLIVRGHCRLRPGLDGYSERIRVRSIIGRFLEHDRIYCFENGGEPEVFIGSADWRERNLNDRVEALVPILEPGLRDRLIEVLELAFADNTLAWELRPDGVYLRRSPGPEEEAVSCHEALMVSVTGLAPTDGADEGRRAAAGGANRAL